MQYKINFSALLFYMKFDTRLSFSKLVEDIIIINEYTKILMIVSIFFIFQYIQKTFLFKNFQTKTNKRNTRPIESTRKKTTKNSNLWKTLILSTNTWACTISTCAFPVWIFFEGGIYCFLCVIGCVCTWVVFYNRDSKERGWYSNRKPSFLLVDI